MGITSTRTSINPLYSEKVFYEIQPSATQSCTTTLANITGWSLTIPKDGKYRMLAQFAFDLSDQSGNGEVEGEYAFALNGAMQADTRRYIQGRGPNSSSQDFDVHHDWIDNFTAGDVITLQAREYNAGTAGNVTGTIGGTREAKFSYELIESVVPIATNVMEQYETGWVACSDWTNQTLGDAVGGNVVHNLETDLVDLQVKVMISTDGGDGNSFELNDYSRVLAGDLTFGYTIYQVDNNTIQIQTALNGLGIIASGTGAGLGIDTEAWYYKIKVVKLASQYRAPAVQRYSTGWVANSDWTNQHLGDSPGGNVTHNLNEPISDLDIKVLVSTDGTDNNGFEIVAATNGDAGASESYGITIFQVDSNSFTVQTGSNGFEHVTNAGTQDNITTEAWYYQVIVTKQYNTLTATVAPVMPSYDTGWVNCTDWTNQALGTAVGGNVVHNLGYNLRELMVQVFLSSDGTDNNSYEMKDFTHDGQSNRGFSVWQVDTDELTVQTGSEGMGIINTGTGLYLNIDTQNWYYRIVVTKIQPVISVRNISEDYSTSETDTGKQWIDGKTIYRKVINFGALPNATSKSVAHGITTIDTLIPGGCQGMAENTATNDMRPIPNTNVSGGSSVIQLNADNTNVTIHTGTTDRSMFDKTYVVLEYTKV